MFEKELIQKFQRIFGIEAVTFDQPGSSQEQEKIFVEVDLAESRISPPMARARVTGTATMFGNAEKLPFGFFAKRINAASPEDTKDLFFSDIEGNTKIMGNLVQRSFSFIYFFRGQYDPDQGKIESVTLTVEETPQ